MRDRFIFLAVLLCVFKSLGAQNPIDQTALSKAVIANANSMASSLNSGDYKGFLKYIHPVRISAGGGEAKMIALLNNQNAQLKSKGVEIKGTVFDQPSEIVRSKNELQCTISQHTELKPAKGRVVTYTTLIAISNDNGKSWKFVDTNNMDMAIIRKLFPNLSSKITVPPKQKPTVYSN